MKPKPLQEVPLDALLTIEQFAAWQQLGVVSVRKQLDFMPGVIRVTRKTVRIHPRTYLDGVFGRKLLPCS